MRQSSGSTSAIRRSKRNAPSNWRWGTSRRGGKASTPMGRVQAVPQPPAGASCNSALSRGPPATAPPVGACYNSALSRGLPTTAPPAGAYHNSAPLQGGILKPPALRVVVDWTRIAVLSCGCIHVDCNPMSAHHGPVDIVRDMLKEGCAVAIFQFLEDLANTSRGDSHPTSP
jgi:hypothetical protein